MIPGFEHTGLLPVGIHWATWPEIGKRYATNSHRRRLLGGLEQAIHALSRAGCPVLYLDGSFVTENPFPRDYDACWETVGVSVGLLDPVFLDFSNSRAAQKIKYLGEFFPAHVTAQASPPFHTFLKFFQIDKTSGDAKGIIGLNLKEQQ
jgi:hypothetical protein